MCRGQWRVVKLYIQIRGMIRYRLEVAELEYNETCGIDCSVERRKQGGVGAG